MYTALKRQNIKIEINQCITTNLFSFFGSINKYKKTNWNVLPTGDSSVVSHRCFPSTIFGFTQFGCDQFRDLEFAERHS